MTKFFGWDEAIGKRITIGNDTSGQYLEVVGVVKDFNQKSLYNPISPIVLFNTYNANILQLKLGKADISSTITQLTSKWKKYFPELPFEYKFLDEDLNSQYVADQKRGKIFASFSILTIIITCLGLLGLTAFTTQQQQKSISIRRVMGASVFQVVTLTSKSYFWLALIAIAVAFPVAWYFMHNWLSAFSYSAGLSILPFILSALIILLAATLTAMYYAMRAARLNPSKSLRSD